ncbi:MAG: hypothetical protein ABL962_12850, partial [Fimbriimonadaceae bacterium]
IYKRHLGIDLDLMVMHVTTTEARMRNLMELGGNSTVHLYGLVAGLGGFERAPQPTPQLLSTPWLRRGFKPFAIDR